MFETQTSARQYFASRHINTHYMKVHLLFLVISIY
jgi:hypothetical protein